MQQQDYYPQRDRRYYNNRRFGRGYPQRNQSQSDRKTGYGFSGRDDKVDDGFNYEDADWMSKVKRPEEDKRVKTDDVLKTKGSSFSDFSLNNRLLRGVLEAGFSPPSPVQEESIPNILMGNNVLCRAKNGTGKTGAYCIPVLQLVDSAKDYIQALILVPTRELALQTARFLKQISKYMVGLNIMCTTGGTLLRDDIMRFRQKKMHLVVATPGRLLDLVSMDTPGWQTCL